LAVPYRSIVPLDELIGSVLDVGASSKKVKKVIGALLEDGRTEFGVLLDVPETELARVTPPEIVEAIMHMRRGEMDIEPGYDGEYGVIRPKRTPRAKPKQQTIVF
jgi:PHP family Zn ribbon phosphoesterase